MNYHYGYTINVSPRKRFTDDRRLIFTAGQFPIPKAVQYINCTEIQQKAGTEYILEKLKDIYLAEFHFEFGDYTWELTQNNCYHIHGRFTGTKDISIEDLNARSKHVNDLFGGGPKSLCVFYTKTKVHPDYWRQYMQKDQAKLFLLNLPLTYDEI